MSDLLKGLAERREAAQAAYEEFVTPLLAEDHDMTDDEETRAGELRGKVEKLDTRMKQVRKDDERNAKFAEARETIGATAPAARVTNEPTTYGEGSPNSYFADFVRAQSPAWNGHEDAVERLRKATHEFNVELATGKPEVQERAHAVAREVYRDGTGSARQAIRDLESRGRAAAPQGNESRAMDTTAGSGGSFSTPVYFVQDYAPFREFGRVFIDQCNKQPLPDYGMTVFLPQVTAGAGVAAQASQNTGITESDPTAGYLSANLTTEAGQVTISQQLLDRAGPNFAFDRLVFDQLRRDHARAVDTFSIVQALASAGTVTYTGSFALTAAAGASSFYTKIAKAKASTVDASGTKLPATHLFTYTDRWEFIQAYTDLTTGRPLVLPDYLGVFQSVAAGSDGKPVVEGDTGYKVQGLRAFEDGNIPNLGTTTTDQAIVAHMPEVWVWEGALTPRVLPQTLGQNLSVILQVYSYITEIVRYPQAVQVINGSAMSAPAF
jgi:hypothetical protein